MTKLLNYLIMLVSVWLLVSPLILGYGGASLILCIVTGIAMLALAYTSLKRKADQWPAMAGIVIGFFLFLWGVFLGHRMGASAGISEILVGFLLALLNLVVLPFQLVVSKVEFVNRNGGELATFTQIRMKNGDILAKAMLLGSMPETIYMRPEEICKAVALMDAKVILSLPSILFKGWRINRSKAGGKV
jgi:hypothetical protein